MIIDRLPIFPHQGAILFPGLHLSLHIFEPCYSAMVRMVSAANGNIGIIQPVRHESEDKLYSIGCLASIASLDALPEDRFNLVLEGQSRFRVLDEHDNDHPWRELRVELIDDHANMERISREDRHRLEIESRQYADRHGYNVDWDSVERLDDVSLVNGISQIVPFDAAAKQALLEADNIDERCATLIQMMHFYTFHDSDETTVHLQ